MASSILHGEISLNVLKIRGQQGYSYLWFLIILIFISVFVSNNLLIYSKIKKRENEEELFRAATIYCKALNEYYTNSPTGNMTYPQNIKDLLNDSRGNRTVRYLRDTILDPITHQEFAYIRNGQQEIVGFYSTSNNQIMRKKIPEEFYYLSTVKRYSDLKFCLY